ncbi:MAG TPA: hypothetical protein DCX06_06625 [Opitutae bacterium]|mgnify:CR=1 FL=1|nr:hypothetical protein [Opitutae bacterium]
MNFRKNQAFWTSVILHLVVLFALLLGVIIEAFKPKEKLHVFQMVDPPSNSMTPSLDTPPPQVQPQESKPLDLPDIPALAPVPEPVLPDPPAPTEAKPKPKPKPVEPLMSADEFFKKNPIKEKKPRTQTQPKPVPNIKLDRSEIRVPDTYIPSPSNQSMTSQEQDAMRRYVGQISAMLNRAWIKPGSLAGLDLKVVATFYVDSSGRISNISFRPGSGNASFDTSVRAAFAKIRTAGPTPTGKGQEIRISFNMLD